jgi:flagellar hook protein FlgE
MGIFDALTTAVSGLQSQSFALQNISGNIANASTVGFKGIDTSFEDMIPDSSTPSSEVAGGVIAQSQQTITTQGTISASTVATNIAINGDGFFSVQQPTGITDGTPTFNGVVDYTRAGDFQVNASGFLVNGAGYFLMGQAVDPKTGNPLGNVPSVLNFSNNFVPAQATTAIQYAANLPTVPVTEASPTAAPGTITANGGLNQTDFGFNNPVVAGTPGQPFVNSSVVGNAAVASTASGGGAITSATSLSSLSPAVNAGDTITVDGTIINFSNASRTFPTGQAGTLTGGVDIATADIPATSALSFSIDGKAVTVPTSAATGGTSSSPAFAAKDIASAINNTSGIDVTASVNASGGLVLTQNTPSTTPISVTGTGPDVAAVFGGTPAPATVAGVSPVTTTPGTAGTLTGAVDIATAGISDASGLNFTVDGTPVSVTTGTGPGATFSANDIAKAINGTSNIDVIATVNAGNELVLTQKTPSAANPISVTSTGADAATVFGGTPATTPGVSPVVTPGTAGTLTGGVDITTPGISDASALNFTVDGTAVSLAAGTGHGTGGTFSANDIETAINNAGTDVTATVSGGAIVLTQNTPSATPITVGGADAATVFGGASAPVTVAGILPTAFTTTPGNLTTNPVTLPTVSLNPGDSVGTLLAAIDSITGNSNPLTASNVNSSGEVTLNSGTASNPATGAPIGLSVTGDSGGIFASLGFTTGTLPSATPSGGSQPGTGFVVGSDVTTFDNESISGGAITVFNSAGTPVNVQLRWAMTGPGTWNLFYQSDPNATGSQTAWTNVGQNFSFNANGDLTSPAGGSITIPNVSVAGQSVGNLQLNFSSGALTQFASTGGTATIGEITQNGFAAGQLQSVAINNSGLVVGTFSNGQNIDLAEITLSHFNGTNFLQALNGEAYAATQQSGAAIQGASGKISGSSLEGSNTDIADQFTQLIVTQQAYSANTKVITTANDMIESLLNVLR